MRECWFLSTSLLQQLEEDNYIFVCVPHTLEPNLPSKSFIPFVICVIDLRSLGMSSKKKTNNGAGKRENLGPEFVERVVWSPLDTHILFSSLFLLL